MPENANNEWDDDEPTIQNTVEDNGGTKKASIATQLVEMAMDDYQLGVSEEGEPFAVERGGPNIASMLRGGRSSLRARLAARYMAATGRAASSSALADAMAVLEGMAAGQTPTPLALRVGRHGDSIVLDLGDPSGRAVVVDPFGWQVAERSPICFRRSALTLPLPTPTANNIDIMEMSMLNISTSTWPLVVGWLVACLIPDIPHPLLFVRGEMGTAKTSSASVITRLIDPSPAPVRAAPRDLEQWAVAASGSWMVALDNLSGIPPWLSDALCRAATGEGLVRRALYTDDGLSVLRFRRAVILTSIDAGALRGDLADRILSLELERIDPSRRRTDADLEDEFRRRHPALLGALLDLLAKVLRELPRVHLDELPRMADFARVIAACDAVTLRDTSSLYLAQGAEIAGDVIDGDPVMTAIRDLVIKQTAWVGTAGELLEAITPDPRPKGWPGGPQVLAGQVKRAAPALRTTGIEVEFRRAGRRRTIALAMRQEKGRKEASQASPAASVPPDQHVPDDGRGDAPPSPPSQASPPPSHETAGQSTSDASDAPNPAFSVHGISANGAGPCATCGGRTRVLDDTGQHRCSTCRLGDGVQA